MDHDILALMKVHDYFQSVSTEALAEVHRLGTVRVFAAGDIAHQPEDPVVSVGFVLRGRLKAVKVDAQGRESLLRTIDRGEQMGMMVGALQEPVPVRVFALEPTILLQLPTEDAMDLTIRHQDLRRTWLKTYAGNMRKVFFGTKPKLAPMMLALIHESPASRETAGKLCERLHSLGESIAVFSDSPQWRSLPGIRYRSMMDNGRMLSNDEIRRQAAEWQDARRIVFDLQSQMTPEFAEAVMRLVDRAIYFVPAAESEAVASRLRDLSVKDRGWHEKLSIAWLLAPGENAAPYVPDFQDLASRDFKLCDSPPKPPQWGRSLSSGLERIVHDLRGARIGVALGGGAARGMSHLGVLKALEEAGIVVDMIAGTSAGAMTGILYSSGLDADYAAEQFTNDLRPSWLFRQLPKGDYWYLLNNYRRGKFDPKLRKHLHHWRLEQLAIPCLSVTVDLVSGTSVVRERGDATHAILESINLPVLSVPICRDGQALVDGGLVNNIPADVLVARGCQFVIAVSVTAKMESRFAKIEPGLPHPRKKPSALQTILRSLLVQNHNLNAIGVQPADVIIAPDVTGFDLSEFMKAKELATIGEATATEQLPLIHKLLHRLDPQLYPLAR